MKTGSMLVRLIAGVPVVAGLCLLQGCATSGDSKTAETPAAFSNVPPEAVAAPTPVASTNAVKSEPVPVVAEKEKTTLKPVPSLTTPYSVKAGETVSEIAAKYGKRWQDVLAVNPELKKDSKLRAGQTVQLPNPVDLAHPKAVAAVHKAKKAEKSEKSEKGAKAEKTEKKPAAEAKPEAAAPAAGEASYTVAKGDTIATIAAKHHVKRADLLKANNLTAKSHLKLGQKLVIPAKGEAAAAAPAEAAPAAAAPVAAPAPDAGAVPPPPVDAAPAAGAAAAPVAAAPVAGTPDPAAAAAAPAAHAAPAAEAKTYTVKEGEDVYAVAIRWGVSPAELKARNNLTSSDLTPGQVLKIPAVAPSAP